MGGAIDAIKKIISGEDIGGFKHGALKADGSNKKFKEELMVQLNSNYSPAVGSTNAIPGLLNGSQQVT